jgi:hypothetical protein
MIAVWELYFFGPLDPTLGRKRPSCARARPVEGQNTSLYNSIR